MIIIDKDDCLTLNRVTLLLTMKEAESLQLQLGELISKPKIRDVHIGDMNSEGEMSVAIYTESNISRYDKTSNKVFGRESNMLHGDIKSNERDQVFT